MNALLTIGGLVLAIFVVTLIASESAHRTKQVDPYSDPSESWTIERTSYVGGIPLDAVWIGVSIIAYWFAR